MRIEISAFRRHLVIVAGKDAEPEPPQAISTTGGDFGFGVDVPTITEPVQRWH